MDEFTSSKLVKKASRLATAHKGWRRYGFGAEIAAMFVENVIDWLGVSTLHVGARDAPMP